MSLSAPNRPNLLAVLNDLIFETKISSTARTVGVTPNVLRSVVELPAAIARWQPSLIIIDLNSMGPSAIQAVELARCLGRGARIVAFVSHVDVELAGEARAAGASVVMPRSRFSAELPKLLAGLGSSPLGDPEAT